MIEKTDYILYGGIAVAILLAVWLAYRAVRKNKSNSPRSQVMNKIQDFYSLQDNKNNKPDINY